MTNKQALENALDVIWSAVYLEGRFENDEQQEDKMLKTISKLYGMLADEEREEEEIYRMAFGKRA